MTGGRPTRRGHLEGGSPDALKLVCPETGIQIFHTTKWDIINTRRLVLKPGTEQSEMIVKCIDCKQGMLRLYKLPGRLMQVSLRPEGCAQPDCRRDHSKTLVHSNCTQSNMLIKGTLFQEYGCCRCMAHFLPHIIMLLNIWIESS